MTATSFVRAYPPATPAAGARILLPIADGNLLVTSEAGSFTLVREVSDRQIEGAIYLGDLNGIPCVAYETIPSAEERPGTEWAALRSLYGALGEDEYALAGYAAQMVHWQATSKFCPVCATATVQKDHDWGKLCPSCGHTGYPRVSPAVLLLVHDGDRILLSHKDGWGPRYSILAGFVEPGESLEECCEREGMEETGISLSEIQYAGSQPWPFPHQVMIGFTARYAGGDIKIDEAELDDARWFHVDEMPELPGKSSLSRKLIDQWVQSRRPV
jgi:NAD+ diphosphatase